MATASGSQPCIQQNCSGCNKPSFSDGTTVACYQCHRWYHDACAGGAVADGSWACVACVLSMSGPAKSIISTSSTRSARVRLELLRLEEVQKVKEKHMLERQEQERLREERTQKEKEDLAQKFIDEKFALLMSETLEDGASSVRSRGSRQRSVDKVNTWMEAGNQETSATDIAFDNSVVSLSQPPARMQNLLQGTPLSSLGAKVVSCTSVTQTLVPPSTPIAIQSTMSLRNVPPGLPATAIGCARFSFSPNNILTNENQCYIGCSLDCATTTGFNLDGTTSRISAALSTRPKTLERTTSVTISSHVRGSITARSICAATSTTC